jgi:hypothetical protein
LYQKEKEGQEKLRSRRRRGRMRKGSRGRGVEGEKGKEVKETVTNKKALFLSVPYGA